MAVYTQVSSEALGAFLAKFDHGELVDRLSERFTVTEREVETNRETIAFKLPRGLEAAA